MWQASPAELWQGRDDSRESPAAKRVFQTIDLQSAWPPVLPEHAVALLGFASDTGVARNLGRVGAAKAPPVLRKALANLASHPAAHVLCDCGDIGYAGDDLESGQRDFAEAVAHIHRHGGKTLVLGGGHETAFAHGSGLFAAHPGRHIAIINFDPHLDLRRHHQATSGTPFAQLAALAAAQNRRFDYTCVGAGRATNTAALTADAAALGVNVIWDTEVHWAHAERLRAQLQEVVARADAVYVTIDLDVLPAPYMPAVSAPAALGIAPDLLLYLLQPIMAGGKVIAADAVEYNPDYDIHGQGARVAARVLWQLWQEWV
ncbi:formiminoglutamase [Neisseria sp. HSC-16F19]|nr:formimidoylglutamase [Neisseria sp. HSC-16F19]MCP2040634.1 formiminoglutamase [Neisseria sp. HSC-16F19]